jgi:hypothetical protein
MPAGDQVNTVNPAQVLLHSQKTASRIRIMEELTQIAKHWLRRISRALDRRLSSLKLRRLNIPARCIHIFGKWVDESSFLVHNGKTSRDQCDLTRLQTG